VPEPVSAPFTRFIGAVAEETGEGYARLSLQTGPEHADALGHVHTGALTSVMDSVIGIALGRLRGRDMLDRGPHATIEMTTSFYGHADPGAAITAEGRVVHVGDDVAFGEVEARLADGRVLAKARLTFVIPGRRP
jgi:uncharacterized protein (TIGR00369 family)